MVIIIEQAELLKFFRMRAKLSKTKVAEYLGVTTATITNYEKGSTFPSYNTMTKLKKLYGPEFEYALSQLYDEGKTSRLEFRDVVNDPPSEDFDVFERCYPRLSKIIAEIKESDRQKRYAKRKAKKETD